MDKLAALGLLRRGADLGNGRAMLQLGLMYAKGRGGLAKDRHMAKKLLGQLLHESDAAEADRAAARAELNRLELGSSGGALCGATAPAPA